MIKKYLEQDALAFHDYESAATVQKILLEQGLCVMMSREENLWMLNWVWTEIPSDRNGVIFINRAGYECDWWNFLKNNPDVVIEENEDAE